MANKEFTRQQLEKAIDLALDRGDAGKARFEGGKEATEIILKMFDRTYLQNELKNDTERLNFIDNMVLALHSHYNEMLEKTANDIWDDILEIDSTT